MSALTPWAHRNAPLASRAPLERNSRVPPSRARGRVKYAAARLPGWRAVKTTARRWGTRDRAGCNAAYSSAEQPKLPQSTACGVARPPGLERDCLVGRGRALRPPLPSPPPAACAAAATGASGSCAAFSAPTLWLILPWRGVLRGSCGHRAAAGREGRGMRSA